MADLVIGEPFGLGAAFIDKIDWQLALKRIAQDLRTDFIYAPHLSAIYAKAGDDLVAAVKADLRSGRYNPGLPLTIEVAKSHRVRVAVPSKRLGPAYSRPGSILLPRDRLFYQALADVATPIVSNASDNTRSFSHQLGSENSPGMFLPTRTCWNALQEALRRHSDAEGSNYILKVDVANFFGSINLHTLKNALEDAGYPKPFSSRLEAVLLRYTGSRSSRGIPQGMFPSDLFGNYYLAPLDEFLADTGLASARYVDDIYVFLESVEAADHLLRKLVPVLRTQDLVLNEAKSAILPKSALNAEEPDLETLFKDALDEVASQTEGADVGGDYGFQSEWSEEDEDEEDLELIATTALFDSIANYPGQEENIERFCLPLFARADSDYAVAHVIESFRKRPSMAQIYSAYLARFLSKDEISRFLLGLLQDPALTDWQRMWVLGALSQANKASNDFVKAALAVASDGSRHEALRAVAAVYVGRFGSHSRRRALGALYADVPEYVKAAIYYSSRFWPSVERSNAKASWSGHSDLHRLLAAALSKRD